MSTRIDIKSQAVSGSTARLTKTNQIVSYRTGDDGDWEEGRDVDYFILAENNPFGNTNRFTDTVGGQTYTNKWIIDWNQHDTVNSQVVGYYTNIDFGLGLTWDQAIDNSLGTFGGFANCRLANIRELFELAVFDKPAGCYSYFPLLFPSYYYASSTTQVDNTGNCFYLYAAAQPIVNTIDKTLPIFRNVIVRTFTVTGTTLT
jgi:hypothetical protein